VTALCKTIAESAPRAGSEGVRLPGANYEKLRAPIDWPNTVEIPDAVWDAFLEVCV
jgi:hypothetical protein